MKRPAPPSDPRPAQFVTTTSEEYFEICRRSHQGEFFMNQIKVGATPGQWVVIVRYPKPYNPQLDLI